VQPYRKKVLFKGHAYGKRMFQRIEPKLFR
jgi:hypothetical protein